MTPGADSPMPSGWQVVLADLSLILFIATAAAMAVQSSPADTAAFEADDAEQVFSSLVAGDDIGVWLAAYVRDPRERLHITIHYREGQFAGAMQRAQIVETAATAAGHIPYIKLERGERDQTAALFAFDMPSSPGTPTRSASLAQELQRSD